MAKPMPKPYRALPRTSISRPGAAPMTTDDPPAALGNGESRTGDTREMRVRRSSISAHCLLVCKTKPFGQLLQQYRALTDHKQPSRGAVCLGASSAMQDHVRI